MSGPVFYQDDQSLRAAGLYAPIPAGSDPQMVQYLTRQRDRMVTALGEIDELLDAHRRALDAYQPKSNRKIGLIWRREPERLNGAVQPKVVRWLIRHFSQQIRWFYTDLPLKNLPRKAKSTGGWALGHEQTYRSLTRIQELIEHRQKLLAQWVNLSRALTNAEKSVEEWRSERQELEELLPKGPFYEQAKKYSEAMR